MDSVGQNAHLLRCGEEFAASHFEDLGRKARICQCVKGYWGDVVRCYGSDLTGAHGIVDRSLCLDSAEPLVAITTTFGGDVITPHQHFHNNGHGYVRCTMTPQLWTSDFRVVPSVLVRDAPVSTLASFVVEQGRAGAQRA